MKIYEHISKELVDVSLDNKNVRMYVCGPTVYNHVHIGNIRPIITFDVLNRVLTEIGYDVKFIHNITDIDDKIIAKAAEENKNELDVSSFYEKQYLEILDKLNIKKANMIFPKVSEHIKDIENYVQKIIDNDFAYISNGDVYFRTSKVLNYGEISNKQINELEVGEKSINNSKKENEKDFVLWKETSKGLNWKTNFSVGRPGWHTECSCLIEKFFKDQCDIHGGGVDLKFPHHENENAQNIAVNNKNISRIWMHVGHLNVDNEKMSKSLGNFILAKDILNQFDSNEIRWFFYQTNYTNPINFTYDNLMNSKISLDNIIKNLNTFKSYLHINDSFNDSLKFDISYIELLRNNFSLPNIVTFINEKIKESNNLLRQKSFTNLNINTFNISYLLSNILGIKINNLHTEENIKLLKEWDFLKNNRDFNNADLIRNKLLEKNLI